MISKIRESPLCAQKLAAVSFEGGDLQDSLVCPCKLSPRRYLGPLLEPSGSSTWFLSQSLEPVLIKSLGIIKSRKSVAKRKGELMGKADLH